MRKLFLLAVVCTSWLMFTESAAANIIYDVNDIVDGGSVVGTITTDGALGPLFTGDIVDFNLMLMDQTDSATLIDGVNGGSVYISGGALVATPTDLEYNFDTVGAFVNFFTTPSGGANPVCTPIWTLRGAGGSTCNPPADPVLGPNPGYPISGPGQGIGATFTSTPAFASESGNLTIASVPEPGSLGLVVVGLVSLIGLRKRRF